MTEIRTKEEFAEEWSKVSSLPKEMAKGIADFEYNKYISALYNECKTVTALSAQELKVIIDSLINQPSDDKYDIPGHFKQYFNKYEWDIVTYLTRTACLSRRINNKLKALSTIVNTHADVMFIKSQMQYFDFNKYDNLYAISIDFKNMCLNKVKFKHSQLDKVEIKTIKNIISDYWSYKNAVKDLKETIKETAERSISVHKYILDRAAEVLYKYDDTKSPTKMPLNKKIKQINAETNEVVNIFANRTDLMSALPIKKNRLSQILSANKQNVDKKSWTKWYDKHSDTKISYYFVELDN